MMTAEDQKKLYEDLDALMDGHMLAMGYNGFPEVLLMLTGVSVERGNVVLDPDTRDASNRVAIRWLRDHGYLPHNRRSTHRSPSH